ncbi:MAG: BMP family ABC transporter substrate-binding protein [Chloroflexi bacterium]|nr:BMP family ABC transporter substrate-binding protein [Chloroflexota bacterium]
MSDDLEKKNLLKGTLGRRELIKLGGVVLGGSAAAAVLAACGGPATPPAAAPASSAAPSSAPASASPSSTAGSASAKPSGSAPASASASSSSSVAASSSAAAKPSGSAGKVIKAAFVYLGTANDHGWTNAHDDGRKFVEQQLGSQVQTAFTENVPEEAASQRVFEDYGQKGYDVVYGTSFGYMDFMLAAAKNFPNTKYEHCAGFKTAPNLSTYMIAQEDGRYLNGILAGKMTKTNTLGFIGSFPIPEVVRDLNGWAQGVRSVNPQAKIHVVWINTWFDPPKETTAANSLLDLKADVLASVTDSPAMSQAAAARKVYACGSDSDQTSYAPTAILSCAVYKWGPHYLKSVKSIMDGTWKNDQVYYHMKDGAIDATPPASFIPADVAKLANDAQAKLKAGQLDIWAGPISDNKGKQLIGANQTLGDIYTGSAPLPGQTKTDAYIQSDQMNWALDIIVGDIPKS